MAPQSKLLLCIMSSALVASGALAQTAMDGGRKLQTTLSGGTTGDPDGSGTATVVVNPGQHRVCFDVQVSGIEPSTAAHIHDFATNGIFIGIDAPTDGDAVGCVDTTREKALELLKHPDQYYVNIHNATYPPGALSGTLAK